MAYCTLDRFSERYVDKLIVVSHALKKKLLVNHNIPEEKIQTIYNAIDLQEYRPDAFNGFSGKIRNEFGIRDTEFMICAIGRMVWQKGFEFFVKALPQIVHEVPKVRCLFVGDGPLRRSLQALTHSLNVDDRVIFTGFRSDIKNFLSALDILVVPSILEGFPMITLEAMASGKPIVATRIEGITEQIMDGRDGILVPAQNHDVIAATVLQLIKDEQLRRRLGTAARTRIERSFSFENMLKETEKVYLSLVRPAPTWKLSLLS